VASVDALVLSEPAASAEPQAIVGLPGLWSHDKAVAAVVPADHGLSVSDVEALAAGLGVSVERVSVERAVETPAESARDAISRVPTASPEDLAVLAEDSRKTVAQAAAAEIERRAAELAATEPTDGAHADDEGAGS
jgi:hypothetical protein